MGTVFLMGVLSLSNAGCIVELEHIRSCGDGFVDPLAGEECEPSIEESYIADACDGTGFDKRPGCDPVTCELTCSYCGDGIVYDDPATEIVEEECDERLGPDDDHTRETALRVCVELRTSTPELFYVAGQTNQCTNLCLYSRRTCSFCGDGKIQGEFLDTQTLDTITAEQCDGPDAEPDPTIMREYFGERCATSDDFSSENADLRPHFSCTSECTLAHPPEGPACCRPKGEACPTSTETPCCYAFNHPDEEPCEDFGISPSGGVTRRCR